jgi:4-amino-4-deoxy-L-arabinose transferase-like glycosyltransferase
MLWLSTVAFLSVHLLILLVLAATSWVAGRVALARFSLMDGAERLAVPLALGLALLGLLLFGLGLLGLLAQGPLLGLLLVVHLAGLGAWREEARRIRWRGAAVGLAAVAVPFFLLALYPPTAFDETLYHLPFAREFVRTGGVPFLPDLRFPVFPQLGEVLMAAVLALTGRDTATHLVQWVATGATAALLIAWGKRAFTPTAGWLAAALFLGYPIVAYLGTTGYIEAELALFVTAGLYCLSRWREEGSRGWLVLAAVFAGSASGTKYLGLFFVAALACEVAIAAPRETKVRNLFLFSSIALLVLAPWYVRILVHTGSPVFPFAERIFGVSDWTFDPILGLTSPAERLMELPRLPWDALFVRERVGLQPPFSPAFLLGLPLVLTGAWRDPRLRRLVLVALVYALVSVAFPPDVRYLTAVLPVLSLVLAVELVFRLRLQGGASVVVLCLLCLLPSLGWAGYRFLRQGPLPVTVEQREHYLAQALPVWPALQFLNRTSGERYTVYALHAERMTYFAEGRFLGDWNGPARYGRVLPLISDPEALWRELRRLGADHLLVVEGTGVRLPENDPGFRRLFLKVYADGVSDIFRLRNSAGSYACGCDDNQPSIQIQREDAGKVLAQKGQSRGSAG